MFGLILVFGWYKSEFCLYLVFGGVSCLWFCGFVFWFCFCLQDGWDLVVLVCCVLVFCDFVVLSSDWGVLGLYVQNFANLRFCVGFVARVSDL